MELNASVKDRLVDKLARGMLHADPSQETPVVSLDDDEYLYLVEGTHWLALNSLLTRDVCRAVEKLSQYDVILRIVATDRERDSHFPNRPRGPAEFFVRYSAMMPKAPKVYIGLAMAREPIFFGTNEASSSTAENLPVVPSCESCERKSAAVRCARCDRVLCADCATGSRKKARGATAAEEDVK
jgi:hypothetical protein